MAEQVAAAGARGRRERSGGRRAINQGRLFLALLGIGSLSVITGRMAPWLFWPLGLVLPVCCILGYGYLNWRLQYADTSRQQVADNAYFLGFLYFLVSLSVTLVLLSADRIVVLEVVKGFGTALVTSIVGLAARILILQGSDDFEGGRDRAEAEYVDAVQGFTRNMRASTELLTAARITFIDQMREVAQATGREMHDIAGSVRASVDGATRDLAAAVGGMNEAVRAIDLGLRRTEQAMGKSVAQMEETSGAAARAAGVAGEAAKSGAEMVRSLVTQLGQIQDAAQRVGTLTGSMQRTMSTAVAIEDSLRRLSLGTQFTALSEQLERHAKALSGMTDSATGYAASAMKARELENGVNGIQKLLEAGVAGQRQIVESLAVLKSMDEGLRRLDEDVKNMAAESRGRRGLLEIFSRSRDP